MFFGAGNILFPLSLGQSTQNMSLFAAAGLLFTAVVLPFLGLIVMTKFKGEYRLFFDKLGYLPGLFAASTIMLLLGPLGSTPRCIALSYASLKIFFPWLSSYLFSLASCLLIYFCTIQKRKVTTLLGYILTPSLLIALGAMVVFGMGREVKIDSSLSSLQAFKMGVQEGYYTMDLLAAFFFSSVIFQSIQQDAVELTCKRVELWALQASLIGASLLSIIYCSFCLLAAQHSKALENVAADQLLSFLAYRILGENAAIVASLIVSLACLSTAIALIAVFAEFIHSYASRGKIGYRSALVLSLSTTFAMANLRLEGIMSFLSPLLQILYPLLILLVLLNLGSLFSPLKKRRSLEKS